MCVLTTQQTTIKWTDVERIVVYVDIFCYRYCISSCGAGSIVDECDELSKWEQILAHLFSIDYKYSNETCWFISWKMKAHIDFAFKTNGTCLCANWIAFKCFLLQFLTISNRSILLSIDLVAFPPISLSLSLINAQCSFSLLTIHFTWSNFKFLFRSIFHCHFNRCLQHFYLRKKERKKDFYWLDEWREADTHINKQTNNLNE